MVWRMAPAEVSGWLSGSCRDLVPKGSSSPRCWAPGRCREQGGGLRRCEAPPACPDGGRVSVHEELEEQELPGSFPMMDL